jgi:hypothetical protein
MTRRSKRTFWGKLRSLGYTTYGEYLESDHWKEVRSWFWARNKNRHCRGCSGKPEQIHHVTYKRLGAEKPYDLVAVCRSCHEAVHESELPNGRLRGTTCSVLSHTGRLRRRANAHL